MFEKLLSHLDKLYVNHIANMLDEKDTFLENRVKIYHDIAKLKDNFQIYIRNPEKNIAGKNHTLLSGYLFLLNNDFDTKEMLFGFLAIVSHHSNVNNFYSLTEPNKYIGKYCTSSKELNFLVEVLRYASELDLYHNIGGSIDALEDKAKILRKYLRQMKLKKKFDYQDFIAFKQLYALLIFSDKYEAIFSMKKEPKKKIDGTILKTYIDNLPYLKRRDKFRKFVLNNFDETHKLFTLTAPTGYGKTLTALEFALKFKKDKIIFTLPFTSIIDQTENIVSSIFSQSDINIFKIHHKTMIDESKYKDRYSKIKFLMNSFSGEINITTLYQIIFALFGNSNKDNVKFNQFKNAVVIIDEAQAIPYAFRKDFLKLCELISKTLGTVFVFMSATMPITSKNFTELSNLDYFQQQNRYVLKWLHLENAQESLIKNISKNAINKHTLCVVNTVKKAQELYLYFRDKFECYCLNGYMSDYDKKATIATISSRLKQDEKKIMLISTQSIEAGIDLDFEVGFREVAPISSIIQTAGRINRNFGDKQGILYVFDDICGYSDLIYGDLQLISQMIFEILKEKDVCEKDILKISNQYFSKIDVQLEKLLLEKEMQTLAFFDINRKIRNIMDGEDYKELIIVEPYEGFIKEIESSLLNLKKQKIDRFKQKDLAQGIVKKLLQYGVNVSKKDIEKFQTRCNKIKYLFEMIYLPYGADEYDPLYGIKKYQQNEEVFS